MNFISYAQNFEDLMLWRALKDVENGFYIDVGAQDSITDSVTKAFYDRGWSGINIEPVDQFYRTLVNHRQRDINIKAAVRSKSGHVVIHAITDTGMSTTHDEIANIHRSNGWTNIEEVVVPAVTLDQVCRENGVGQINFLKIDVEGDESEVLAGLSLTEFRPWILVIEATAPTTNADISAAWMPYVTSKRYELVYFDGLNKFFVAEEHSELAEAFAFPPNPIDDYITLPVVNLRDEIDKLNSEIDSLNGDLEAAVSASIELEECRVRLETIEASRFWRAVRFLDYLKKRLQKHSSIIFKNKK